MIYVTGDCHQDLSKLFTFAEKMELNEDDIIIVLGDMGICWRSDREDFNHCTEAWENFEYKCNLYWIDGNHENFDIIKELPIENNIRKCSEHIYMLMRGRHYNFEGLDILTIGGADSVDRYRRIEGISWWKDEQITDADIADIDTSIEYDYVFTHTAPQSIFNDYKVYLADVNADSDETSALKLDEVKSKIKFKHWWFGHHHTDINLDNQFSCLFNSFKSCGNQVKEA